MLSLSSAITGEDGITDGKGKNSYLQQLVHAGKSFTHPTPLYLIAGSKDLQCPPQAVEITVQMLRKTFKNVKYEVFGKDQGQVDNYGHFDLLIGKRVESEVFPKISEWLISNDDPR